MSLLGFAALAYAASCLNFADLTWQLGITLLFSVLVAPRLNITLPHAGLTLSFSDAVLFFAFIVHGGPIAVILSSFEIISSFFYLKRRGVAVRAQMIPFNVAIASITTLGSVLFVQHVYPYLTNDYSFNRIGEVFAELFALALIQFAISSALTAAYYSLATSKPFAACWKNHGVPLAITNVGGALFAGLGYFIFTTRDLAVALFSTLVGILLYFNYKQVVTRMSESIDEARRAERKLVETERKKNDELQKYAGELAASLFKGEQIMAELYKSRQAFKHAALHDSLTGLPNRAYLGEMLKEIIGSISAANPDAADSSARTGRFKGHVLFLDLARFKSINDVLGHGIGDRVLEIAAHRFRQVLEEGDVAARIGGDEFAILLMSARYSHEAEETAWKIHRRISEPISVESNRINVGVNIGLAPLSEEYGSPEEILRDADIAMHYAQSRGTGVEVFNADLREASLQRAQIEAELPFAIERDELFLNFQPIVSLKDGSLIGTEALLRWNHPKRGNIAPVEFIPIAEECGLIIPMTSWILDQACRTLSQWQNSAPHLRDLLVSVNISGRHLSHQSLFEDIEAMIAKYSVRAETLKLEITESVAMENARQTIDALNRLKKLGVQLSIDDFGTGYSSLSYLHELPFDTLKIDRSFVKDVGEHGENSEVLRTIIALAKSLDMRVVAEGIETERQLSLLQSLDCEYGQGYLMSKPVSAAILSELILRKKSWLPESADRFKLPPDRPGDRLSRF